MATTVISEPPIELRAANSTSEEVPDWERSTAPAETDAIVEASRLADAEAPDGGHGWVIVAACAIITFWFMGTTYSWGVIQDALVQEGLSTPSTLSFVGSTAVAGNAAFAIPNARLIRTIGAQKTAFVGITTMALAQFLSSFAVKSVAGLVLTAGVMMGYGVSASYMVVSVTPTQYFSRRRGLAFGIVFAGGGLGGAITSLAMSAIVSRLGIAWTFRILAFLMCATGLPAAWLIKERMAPRSTTFFEWRLFRDVKFLALFCAGMVALFPFLVPPFFLPLYARSLHYPAHVGASLVAAFNFSSALGRILCGWMGDKVGPVNSLFVSLFLSALSMLTLWGISTSLGPLILFVITCGMSSGGFFAIMPTVVGNLFGSARVSTAMGMVVSAWTPGYLMGAPIAGYILDAAGGDDKGIQPYRPAIFYAGSMTVGATALVGLVRLQLSKHLLKRL